MIASPGGPLPSVWVVMARMAFCSTLCPGPSTEKVLNECFLGELIPCKDRAPPAPREESPRFKNVAFGGRGVRKGVQSGENGRNRAGPKENLVVRERGAELLWEKSIHWRKDEKGKRRLIKI